MNSEPNNDVFVKVKDTDGTDLVCPVGVVEGRNPDNTETLEDCFEADVIGRYAGRIKIVDPVA